MDSSNTKSHQYLPTVHPKLAFLGGESRTSAHILPLRPSHDPIKRTSRLPAVLTTEEFGFLVRYDPQVVRRYIRQRRIKALGRPARIPCRELGKFGVDLGDAAMLLAERTVA